MNEFYLIIRIAKKKPPFTKGGFFLFLLDFSNI